LQTSILEQLSGPLCDAVRDVQHQDVDLQNGQQVLDRLQEANLFVVPLDDERRWYRYHHLFADLLRQRLLQNQPALIPELHCRASRWYEQNSFLEEAVDHALRGDDPGRAALLIEHAAESILMRGELVILKAWFDALPQEMVSQRALLGLYYAAVLLLKGEPLPRIQPYLRAAATQGIPDVVTQGTRVLRALLALWQGDVAQSIELGQQALAFLPERALFWRSAVTSSLGVAYRYSGTDPDLAERMLQQAVSMGERAGNVMGAVIALCNLAKLRAVQGQLGAAKTLYDRALALTIDDRGHHRPIGGMAIAGIAGLLLEWDKLEEAERVLTADLDLTDKEMPIEVLAADGYLVLARVKAALGEAEAAQAAIEQARTVAVGTGATEFDDWAVAAVQAHMWIAQGQLDAAVGWARHRGLADEAVGDASDAGHGGVLYALYELERLTLAELWMAQDEVTGALDLLEALLARSRVLRRTDTAIKALVLIALAHHQLKHPERALTAAVQALTLAQSGGYVRTFVDRGPPMAGLLCQALAQGVEMDYVRRLLQAFDPGALPPTGRQELVEPLSDRELQVLRLMATHLSNAEIGEQLYISVNTVRFHTKNIYAKLSVHTRQDAIERAQELGML
jgi:LuxR family maltose regulon positive regulatory protein